MLLVGIRWDDLGWRDQLDVVEAVLGDDLGVDTALDALEDQITEMFPEEETWGSSPGALRAQQAAESQWGDMPRVRQRTNETKPPTPPRGRAPFVRSGNPYEAALFVSIGKALVAIPRPAPPPTVVPE